MPGVGQFSIGVSEFVEKWVAHGLDSGKTLGWRIFQQSGDQINGLVGSSSKDLWAWELVLVKGVGSSPGHTLLKGCGLI